MSVCVCLGGSGSSDGVGGRRRRGLRGNFNQSWALLLHGLSRTYYTIGTSTMLAAITLHTLGGSVKARGKFFKLPRKESLDNSNKIIIMLSLTILAHTVFLNICLARK